MKMGGSEHLVWDLIRNLDRNSFSPHLAWFYQEKPLQEFLDLNIPLYHVPKKKRFDFKTMQQLADIISRNAIDVVNAHHYLSFVYSFYGCKIANRKGLLYTEHSAWELQSISTKWKYMGRLFLRMPNPAIGISEMVSNELKKVFWLPAKAVETITNGVDCVRMTPTDNKDQAKKKVGLQPKDIVLGIVANLKQNKNHIYLLKAFKRLHQESNHLKLLVVGQGFEDDPESSELEIRDYITKNDLHPAVSLLGSCSNVPEILQSLDIFCLTSYQEGLPISLIEAMATSLPVVGTRVPGIQDVILHEKNGYLVELNNVEELVTALKKLIEDPSLRLTLGIRSRKIAEENYAFSTCIRRYQDLFSRYS